MKSTKFIFATLTIIILSVVNSLAQHNHSNTCSSSGISKSPTSHSPVGEMKVETFKVSGVCVMCKSNIEKAAKIKGVSKAEWNFETNILTLAYDSSIVTSATVLKLVADSGYDNEKYNSSEKSYNALPGCCKYDRTEIQNNRI